MALFVLRLGLFADFSRGCSMFEILEHVTFKLFSENNLDGLNLLGYRFTWCTLGWAVPIPTLFWNYDKIIRNYSGMYFNWLFAISFVAVWYMIHLTWTQLCVHKDALFIYEFPHDLVKQNHVLPHFRRDADNDVDTNSSLFLLLRFVASSFYTLIHPVYSLSYKGLSWLFGVCWNFHLARLLVLPEKMLVLSSRHHWWTVAHASINSVFYSWLDRWVWDCSIWSGWRYSSSFANCMSLLSVHRNY